MIQIRLVLIFVFSIKLYFVPTSIHRGIQKL